MELLNMKSIPNKKNVQLKVTEDNFHIEGDFYYLVNKEFREIKNGKDNCPLKEYLGLGTLKKRSPKKMFAFVILATVLALCDTIAGKMSDYLFFVDTGWTDYIINALVILCIIRAVCLFFSKKKVIEISFVSKRFCVDDDLFCGEDMDRLHQILLRLR